MRNSKGVVGIVLIVIVAILAIFGLSCVVTYNSLVNLEEDVNKASAEVQNQMQRRAELIPDLVATVKNYTKHEEKIYEDIANARAALTESFKTGNPSEISEANSQLTTKVNSLLAIAENYPTLTAGEQYTSLMDQLEGSVNRITVARGNYNDLVAKYNKKVRNFPGSILASMFGFEQLEQYKADESANKINMVDFGD